MENEEKKGCCEGKEKCEHGMPNCCHNWKKCHMMRKIIWIIILIIVFCFGSQYGEMKAERKGEFRLERNGMMNYGYGKFENQINPQQVTGEVTVDVSKTPTAPVAPKQ